MNTLCRIATTVNPVEVALYAGLPGLIYSIKEQRYDPFSRFVSCVKQESINGKLEKFLEQFCTGEVFPDLEYFAEYTYRDAANKVVWPLCYTVPFSSRSNLRAVARLIVDVITLVSYLLSCWY